MYCMALPESALFNNMMAISIIMSRYLILCVSDLIDNLSCVMLINVNRM